MLEEGRILQHDTDISRLSTDAGTLENSTSSDLTSRIEDYQVISPILVRFSGPHTAVGAELKLGHMPP